jgi:hypothetical protein
MANIATVAQLLLPFVQAAIDVLIIIAKLLRSIIMR